MLNETAEREQNRLTDIKQRLTRYTWLIPIVSFAAGWGSFLLVQRGEELARLIALLALLGWLWVLAEPLIINRFFGRERTKLSTGVSNFFSQSIQQEILFFSLPFLFAATNLADIGQMTFTVLVVGAAAISTIDPWYEKLISRYRMASLAFHASCCFVGSLVILPIVLKLPVGKTLLFAIVFLVVWLVLTLPKLLFYVANKKRGVLIVVGLWTMPFSIWLLRANIPAAGLQVTDATIALGVVEHEPVKALTDIKYTQLKQGVYAHIAIKAPRGLEQEISFKWRHDDYAETIKATITGGREDGYRTYSMKSNFPEQSFGQWNVEVITAQGQLLEKMSFQVLSSEG